MSKASRKSIMHRSKLKKIYNKKGQMQLGDIKNRIFVPRYFGIIRKTIFEK